MPTVFVKDDLRAAVEAATGGLVTVHYTARGVPSYFRWFPRFNLEDLGPDYGSGPHPAFIVDGVVRDGLWIGVYPGTVRDGELLSLPGVVPDIRPLQDMHNFARAAGPGIHVMTNAEWAALALWMAKSGHAPRGNTNFGRSHAAAWESGRRVDGGTPGNTSGNSITITGSGPVSWRHDNTPAGIADLVGNIWEITPGARLVDGEVQIIENNNAATAPNVLDSAVWKAIRLSDGALVEPGTSGTAKYNGSVNYTNDGVTSFLGSVVISGEVTNRSGPVGDHGNSHDYYYQTFSSISAASGVTVPSILRALLLAPGSLSGAGQFSGRNHGIRYVTRGGSYATAAGGAGMFSIDANHGAYIALSARIVKL